MRLVRLPCRDLADALRLSALRMDAEACLAWEEKHGYIRGEVLPEPTATFGRGDTFAACRTLSSLQEYVLVDMPSRRVESFRRTPDKDWFFHDYWPDGEDCLFPTLKVSMPFDELFENVFPESSGHTEEQIPNRV